MVYEPAEDSYLLSRVIVNYLKDINKNKKNKLKVIDIGSGSGILAETCLNNGINRENILAIDIDEEAVKTLKLKKIHVIKSNLFNKINKKNKFDLIVFNAPYLPEDADEPENSRLATTAGKKGNEIILRFLKQAKEYINETGSIFLLFSSLSKPEEILSSAEKLKYEFKLIAEEKLFFEKIFVYEFSL
jgi:HemK-related putative methylase